MCHSGSGINPISLVQRRQSNRSALHDLTLIVLRVILKVMRFLRGVAGVQVGAVLSKLSHVLERVPLRLIVAHLPSSAVYLV